MSLDQTIKMMYVCISPVVFVRVIKAHLSSMEHRKEPLLAGRISSSPVLFFFTSV